MLSTKAYGNVLILDGARTQSRGVYNTQQDSIDYEAGVGLEEQGRSKTARQQ